MKRLMFVIMLMFTALPVFCQVVDPAPVTDYMQYFLSLGGFVLLINLATEFLRNLLNLKKFWLQFTSWLIGFGLALLAWVLNLGMFAGLEYWGMLALGFAGSLCANGVFDTGVIEWILRLLHIYSPPEKKKIT